uniref:U1-type domain-containing protein n=1 Tax=Peronospora matthiolae TaxID=2874970 RepID=A0AAV1U879_9STRA
MDKSPARKGAGVANVVRQTWDRAHYEKLAKLRADGQVEHEETKNVITSSKEEFQTASEGAAGPAGSARAFLKARSSKISLENSVGTVKVVKSDDLSKSSGYYCEVCECSLKDSVAYLDHINGKKHLRKLGYSMRVERSTVDQVKSRLQSASKRKWDPLMTKKLDAMEDYEKKLKAVEEEEARVKRRKNEEKKAKKLGKTVPQSGPDDTDNAEKKEVVDEVPHAEMLAIMGFSGFGGSSKS